MRFASLSDTWLPKVILPRESRVTLRSVLPSVLISTDPSVSLTRRISPSTRRASTNKESKNPGIQESKNEDSKRQGKVSNSFSGCQLLNSWIPGFLDSVRRVAGQFV